MCSNAGRKRKESTLLTLFRKKKLPELLTVTPDDTAYITLLPGVDLRSLYATEESESAYLKLLPNARLLIHQVPQYLCEIEFVLLEGQINLGEQELTSGDFCLLNEANGAWLLKSEGGGHCFIRGERVQNMQNMQNKSQHGAPQPAAFRLKNLFSPLLAEPS
jgi:hypothetical protein